MTNQEKLELKNVLEEKINKTQKDILEYRELTRPEAPDVAIGRVSRMDAINNRSILEAGLRAAENKLSKLKNALDRIDEKNFGQCIKCSQPIPFQRLLIMPESVKCINCA
ncbi:MAG: TraR/DksA family transcriptional regulator [Bacteroidetes bacterium HGW-Bacteroidetes-23]|nr:MAG: TraR/DksA family transcriptional regulator [Bacteroidetes bacterium HGW-Bacteroidetes-23]